MADHRHKRDTDARRFFSNLPTAQKLSAGLAVVATTSVVAVGVLGAGPVARDLVAADARPLTASLSSTSLAASADASERFVVSRSASRKQDNKDAVKEARADGALAATATAVRKAVNNGTKLWTTTALNLWTESGDDAQQVGEIPASRQVLVTGRQAGERVEIVVAGKSRWVTDGYLERGQARALGVGAGLSMAPCPDSGRERAHLRRRLRLPLGVPRLPADHVVRRVGRPRRARLGPRARHHDQRRRARQRDRGRSSGRTPPSCTSTTSSGASTSGRRCARPRAGGLFPSRGSATANHYDHVHVSVY